MMKPIVKLGLFGGLLYIATQAFGGKGAGEVIEQGTATGATDEQQYEWRVIKSEDGAELPFAGQARKLGAEGWTVEMIVAFGTTADETRVLTQTWLRDNT